ncbi:MAG: SDR family oxidoreductase [Thermoflavifilum aggregans]|nr:SDR family oxidoreductase [Thermoflavifilum aggregans]
MESLSRKHILVFGATGGMGTALCSLLAASGAYIWISGRNKEKLQSIQKQFPTQISGILPCDIRDESAVQALAAKFQPEMGHLDVLINLSGIGILKPLEQLSVAEFEEVMRVNAFGAFYIMKHFMPLFRARQEGLIVHVPGILGKVPMSGAAAYCASKYALVGMVQSIREEIKRTRIRITMLYLGGVDTPFWDQMDVRFQRERMIRADEAARAIWYICQQPDSGVLNEMVLQPFSHQVL